MSQEATPNNSRAVHFAGLLARSARRSVGTARKFTPYRATPASRRIRNRQGARDPSRRNVAPEDVDLSAFTQKSFQAHKLTPFYEFSYKQKDLKSYGRMLGAFLQAEKMRGLAVDVEDSADSASFTIKKGIKQGQGDADCIEILLKTEPKNGAPRGQKVVVLSALLCSVNLNEDVLPAATSFTALPVMLVKGGAVLTRQLCSWLESQFDCSVSPLRLSPVQLSWMVAMWSGDVTERAVKPVQLQYAVPPQVKGLGKITMTIDARDCQALWKSIHDGESDRISSDEVTTFIKSLEGHFYHFFEIHLSRLKLSQIGTAIALVGVTGKIKIFSGNHVINVLAHLTEICSEQLLEI